MLKKLLAAAAVLAISASAYAVDFRTVSITASPAIGQTAGGDRVEKELGQERPYALTGKRDTRKAAPAARLGDPHSQNIFPGR